MNTLDREEREYKCGKNKVLTRAWKLNNISMKAMSNISMKVMRNILSLSWMVLYIYIYITMLSLKIEIIMCVHICTHIHTIIAVKKHFKFSEIKL